MCGLLIDAVSYNYIAKMLGDYEMEHGWKYIDMGKPMYLVESLSESFLSTTSAKWTTGLLNLSLKNKT